MVSIPPGNRNFDLPEQMVEEHENELVAEAARRHLGSEIAAERRAQLARRVRELVGRLRGK